MTTESEPSISILLGALGDFTRSGLLSILQRDPRFTVVGETVTDVASVVQRLQPGLVAALTDLVAKAHRLQPDLIILDPVAHRDIDYSRIDALHMAAPGTRLVILTSFFEPHAFVAALLRRVHGYFLPDFAAHGDWLLDTLALIARSSVIVADPEIAHRFWPYPNVPIP